jgi:hypothetical protein
MINEELRIRVFVFALFTLTAFAMVSCSTNESKVKKVLQESLKPHGVTDVVVDLFYTDPNVPDKAYTSATVTYNFATAEGKPQKEYLGFVLFRSGESWGIERSTNYTKETDRAAAFLAGGK